MVMKVTIDQFLCSYAFPEYSSTQSSIICTNTWPKITFYPKLFCFQNGNSTDHAVVQLTDQITESLKIKNIQLVYLFTF